MFEIVVISAYISILALVFTSLVLYKIESKRTLAIGFIIESVVILAALLNIHDYLYNVDHILRIISSVMFVVYAWRLQKNSEC